MGRFLNEGGVADWSSCRTASYTVVPSFIQFRFEFEEQKYLPTSQGIDIGIDLSGKLNFKFGLKLRILDLICFQKTLNIEYRKSLVI